MLQVMLRYLARDILRQGWRSGFVLLILALVSAALMASLSLAETMVRSGMRQWQAEFGQSDLLIQASRQSGQPLFRASLIDTTGPEIDLAVGRLTARGQIRTAGRTEPAILTGASLADLTRLVDLHLKEVKPDLLFTGRQAILSAAAAARLQVIVGDLVELEIQGNRHAFEIAALAYAEGPFVQEDGPITVLVPLDKLQSAMGVPDRVDSITLRLVDRASLGPVMRAMAQRHPALSVTESYPEDHARLQANRTQVPFLFISIILCFMAISVLVILFTGLVTERLALIGLFRAFGASRTEARRVLLAESLCFGLLGGIAGWALGIGLLAVLVRQLNAGTPNRFLALQTGWIQLALSLGTALAVSLAASWLAFHTTARLSVSSLIRGQAADHGSGRLRPLPLIAMLLAPLTLLLAWQNEKGLVVYLLALVVLLAGLVLLLPRLAPAWLSLSLKAGARRAGPGIITVYQARRSRDFLVLVTLLSLIVTTVLIVHAISTSETRGQVQLSGQIHYQLELFITDLNRSGINRISQISGVDAACPLYTSGSVEVAGQRLALYRVQGVPETYSGTFRDLQLDPAQPTAWPDLFAGRGLLLTQTMRRIYKVAAGDPLILKIYARDRSYREVAYTVVGFFDDYQTKLGRYALISDVSFREDFAAGDYDSVLLQTADAIRTRDTILETLGPRPLELLVQRDVLADLAREGRQVVAALQLIAALSVLIGILGLTNTALLLFMRRRREISLYYAFGLTSDHILRLFLGELLLAGALGSLNGLAGGLLVAAAALPRLVFALQIALRISIGRPVFWLGPAVGMGIAACVSLLCLVFLNRSNPMRGLREGE
ncbi:MAG: FtsX-like permease family protein [Clostridiaceae bacterium]|jgi:putative ABC transport system permease protein|nr:FtsX-like permease family protein [Clostridiaceae bacterium]